MSTRFSDFHRNEDGTISIVAVFAALLFTMLLGMVLNVGRHADGKIRMQNAADAVAYSGSSAIARGMNTLAFTNHLLCDLFAMTAFMREARDRNAEDYVPAILAAWNQVGPVFPNSRFPKFERLGPAIVAKTPLEQELVRSYSEWGTAASERILPLLEEILAQEMIPDYQRAVVQVFPDIAQMAAAEVASRDGNPAYGRGPMLGVLWRTSVVPVGGDGELADSTLPVVDPVAPGQDRYLAIARRQRQAVAHAYLNDWNNEAMWFFDREAKMCQFGSLWRGFTCGHLNKLLDEEYPRSNLPHVIRMHGSEVTDSTAHLAEDFTFIGVAYWHRLPESLPGLFRNPIESDPIAYAEARVFVPRSRLVWHHIVPGGGASEYPVGGIPGDFPGLPPDDPPTTTPRPPGDGRWVVGRQGVPEQWDLFNQHWTAQLVPATQPCLVQILRTPPDLPQFNREAYQLPNLGGLRPEDLARISTH